MRMASPQRRSHPLFVSKLMFHFAFICARAPPRSLGRNKNAVPGFAERQLTIQQRVDALGILDLKSPNVSADCLNRTKQHCVD